MAQAQIGDREGAQKSFAALIAAAEEEANSVTAKSRIQDELDAMMQKRRLTSIAELRRQAEEVANEF